LLAGDDKSHQKRTRSIRAASYTWVAAVLTFMVMRGSVPGPLFIWENGQFLTRERMVAELHRALLARGLKR
jgi:hypothetical protein